MQTPTPAHAGPAVLPLAGSSGSLLERLFKLQAHGTTTRTELIAGLTTFLTIAYIIFVNPAILGDAGMPKGSVFVATCLIAACGTLVMGLLANYPIAMAPGMGLNAYFAYVVVLGMGYKWKVALGAVFVARHIRQLKVYCKYHFKRIEVKSLAMHLLTGGGPMGVQRGDLERGS